MIEIGTIVRAVIERIEPYGVFLRAGNEPIFVDVTNICWSPHSDPTPGKVVGDDMDVMILRYNYDERITVGSFKHAHREENPYRKLARLSPDAVLRSSVRRIHQDLITVELEGGAVGLIRNRDLPATFQVGQVLLVRIESLEVDAGELFVRPVN